MSEEWGPWIEHDGKGCPVIGQWVRCEMEAEPGALFQCEGRAGSQGAWSWDWSWWLKIPPGAPHPAAKVIRYRIRKPRGLVILEQIAQGVKQPEDA